MTPLRVDLKSADGTPIAVWREGQGAPLVLIHGSLRDHTVFEPLIASLRDRFTLYAMDRRGYGASGDSRSYTIQQDFHDVAVVVDHVQQRTGGPVALMGHSYGAGCAMGAATITSHLHRLILYEPGPGDRVSARLDRCAGAGARRRSHRGRRRRGAQRHSRYERGGSGGAAVVAAVE
jgi:pimeloyl-ACP methyl ester carboxylesterase